MNENDIGGIVVDCAVKAHLRLGPGLLESVYEAVILNSSVSHGFMWAEVEVNR
jgi:PD-(D/E)XK nuclease superfamily